MKYSEFKAEVENMGYTYHDGMSAVHIHNSVGAVAVVGKDGTHIVSTSRGNFRDLEELEKGRLFNLCRKLAKTPLAEREDEKRYYLELKIPHNVKPSVLIYINQEVKTGQYSLGSQHETLHWKTTFLKSELTDLDLTHINLIEVSEFD